MTKRLEVGKKYWFKGKLIEDDKTNFPYHVEIGDFFFCFSEDIEAVEVIPEQKKVTIPKFVAEWIEKCKAEKFTLSYVFSGKPKDVNEWVVADYMIRCDTIARAWLDGYEVKEEPLGVLLVDMPHNAFWKFNYLYRGEDGEFTVDGASESTLLVKYGYKITEAEAKEKYPNFRWVSLEELE